MLIGAYRLRSVIIISMVDVVIEEVEAVDGEEVILVEQGLASVPVDVAEKYGGTATLLNLTENAISSSDNLEKFEYLETLVLIKTKLLTWMVLQNTYAENAADK